MVDKPQIGDPQVGFDTRPIYRAADVPQPHWGQRDAMRPEPPSQHQQAQQQRYWRAAELAAAASHRVVTTAIRSAAWSIAIIAAGDAKHDATAADASLGSEEALMTLQGTDGALYETRNGTVYQADASGYITVTNLNDRGDLIRLGCMDLTLRATGASGEVPAGNYIGGRRVG